MSASITKPRKRLTREQSKAQTRAKLIAVGRRHFLKYGLGGAVAERIAEDAGFSRGALYSNFVGKEELFIAIIREEHERRFADYHSILTEKISSKERLRKLRDRFVDTITDPEWVVLRADFEAEAMRNDKIRPNFVEAYNQEIRTGTELMKELLRSPDIHLSMKPNEFINAMTCFAHGLAAKQKILGSKLSQRSTRALIQSLFDHLVSAD